MGWSDMAKHTQQYFLNHHLVNKVRGPAKLLVCEHCGERAAEDWATVTGLNSETDPVDPWTGFIALCRRCHRAYDEAHPTWWIGRHHTPESIEKIRQAKLGVSSHTPESRTKISEALRGRPKSPETRERMRQAQGKRRRATAEERAERLERQHGTTTGYRKGCRCDLCRAAHNAAYHASKESDHG